MKFTIKNPKLSKIGGAPREKYDPRKHGVSQSAIQSLLTCTELTRLKYICDLRPAYEKPAFFQGGTYHNLLEKYYISIRDQTGPFDVDVEIDNISKSMRKKGSSVSADLTEDTLDLASVLIPAYMEHWNKDETYEWNMIEKEFNLPIKTEIGIVPFKGKVDGAFISKGRQWLFETKFKASWNESYIEQLVLDLQVHCYIAAMSMMKKEPVGCVFNIVRKPQLKRKKTEGRKEFLDRVHEDIQSRTDFYFCRNKIQFSRDEVEAAKSRVVKLVNHFAVWWKTNQELTGITDKCYDWNSGACDSKYGACQMLPVCANGDLSYFKPVAK